MELSYRKEKGGQDGNSDKSHEVQKEEFLAKVAARHSESLAEQKARTTSRELEAHHIAAAGHANSHKLKGGDAGARAERNTRAQFSAAAAGPSLHKLSDEEHANHAKGEHEHGRRAKHGVANEDD